MLLRPHHVGPGHVAWRQESRASVMTPEYRRTMGQSGETRLAGALHRGRAWGHSPNKKGGGSHPCEGHLIILAGDEDSNLGVHPKSAVLPLDDPPQRSEERGARQSVLVPRPLRLPSVLYHRAIRIGKGEGRRRMRVGSRPTIGFSGVAERSGTTSAQLGGDALPNTGSRITFPDTRLRQSRPQMRVQTPACNTADPCAQTRASSVSSYGLEAAGS